MFHAVGEVFDFSLYSVLEFFEDLSMCDLVAFVILGCFSQRLLHGGYLVDGRLQLLELLVLEVESIVCLCDLFHQFGIRLFIILI